MNNNINSLSIKNYKNLKDFKVDSLSRVNLIVGKNNSGKSTLLEAISIYATNGHVEQIKKILKIRGMNLSKYRSDLRSYNEKDTEALSTLYTGMKKSNFFLDPIEIEVNNDSTNKITIKLVRMIVESVSDNGRGTRITKTRRLEEDEGFYDNSDVFEQLYVKSEETNKLKYNSMSSIRTHLPMEKTIPTEYVKTSDISSEDNYINFDKIAMTELEKELVKALNILDSRIYAINFLSNENSINSENYINQAKKRVPMVTLEGSETRYPLSTMGDGANRILTIILAMLNCKDGIFLVDEFDNGLHYSVQTKLWEMVYRLAEKLNIQVFATTHSNDCIKSFIEAGEKQKAAPTLINSKETPTLIRLEKRGDNVVAVSYDDSDELECISSGDIEAR